MKALFISFNQAVTPRVMEMLDNNQIKGYTLFPLTHGSGSHTGEPHMGSHAWPAMNSTVLAVVEDAKIEKAMNDIRQIDKVTQLQGIRAFVWDVTEEM